jgi:hypothetical protein
VLRLPCTVAGARMEPETVIARASATTALHGRCETRARVNGVMRCESRGCGMGVG